MPPFAVHGLVFFMSKRLKMLPVAIMLFAGAFTSIATYALHYETKTALLVLLGVLVFFYVLGLIFQKIIHKFEEEIAAEEERLAAEEGKVLEKDGVIAEGMDETHSDNPNDEDTEA